MFENQNTKYLKLPGFDEILNGCQPPFGKQSSKNYIAGMRYMYNFIHKLKGQTMKKVTEKRIKKAVDKTHKMKIKDLLEENMQIKADMATMLKEMQNVIKLYTAKPVDPVASEDENSIQVGHRIIADTDKTNE